MEKLITFDCYGTLVDTSSCGRELEQIGREYELDSRTIRSVYELNEARLMYAEPFLRLDELIKTALERCDVMMGTSVMAGQWERIVNIHEDYPAFPEVVPVLEELNRRNYRLVIMSNSCHFIMKHNLETLGGQIDEVILAEDVQAYKPQLSFFEKSAEQLEIDGKKHCHVAQGYFEDIIPCSRLSWNKVWVNREGERADMRQKPLKEVERLDQILELFP